jgi:pSer/pThr/pTyr-binding forkhead associated (FHA) protein
MQIVDPTVSRHHCVIWRVAGRCWIRDLGSTNHTRVNNQSARVTELFEGDVVIVGQTALTLAANAIDGNAMSAGQPESPGARIE